MSIEEQALNIGEVVKMAAIVGSLFIGGWSVRASISKELRDLGKTIRADIDKFEEVFVRKDVHERDIALLKGRRFDD